MAAQEPKTDMSLEELDKAFLEVEQGMAEEAPEEMAEDMPEEMAEEEVVDEADNLFVKWAASPMKPLRST